jgi:hypothetical protein
MDDQEVLSKYCRFVLIDHSVEFYSATGLIDFDNFDTFRRRMWSVHLPDRPVSLIIRYHGATPTHRIYKDQNDRRLWKMRSPGMDGLIAATSGKLEIWTEDYTRQRMMHSRSTSLLNLIVRKVNNGLFPQTVQMKCEWFLNHIDFHNEYFEYGAHKSAETDEIFVCSQECI